MTQWVRSLLCNHRDPSSSPQCSHNSFMSIIPALGWCRQAHPEGFLETLSQKQGSDKKDSEHWLLASTSVYAGGHSCTPPHTHLHTHIHICKPHIHAHISYIHAHVHIHWHTHRHTHTPDTKSSLREPGRWALLNPQFCPLFAKLQLSATVHPCLFCSLCPSCILQTICFLGCIPCLSPVLTGLHIFSCHSRWRILPSS